MDFKDSDSFNKAIELHGSELDGYPLSIDEAKPRESTGFGGRGTPRGGGGSRGRGGRFGDRNSGGRFGDRSGGGRSGGRDGGRGGRRGGGRFGFNKPSLAPEGTGIIFFYLLGFIMFLMFLLLLLVIFNNIF